MKANIYVVDLQDHTIETLVAEGNTPVECYLKTMDDEDFSDQEAFDHAVKFYTERLKENEEGKWVIDCEDGLIFINQITE